MIKKIGNVTLKSKVALAPMAGVTNQSFREICRGMGAGLVVSEMISDKGLIYQNQKTLEMIPKEKSIATQIFGSSVETITQGVGIILEHSNPDIIDINMGCPVNKVIKSGAGSALLKDPQKIYDIVKSLKDNYNKPVSIKIRAGFDHSSINCDKVASIATKAGVDAITIHGRTRSDMYTGSVNLDYIKMVRDNTDVFVFGNGDIKSVEDASKMYELGVDGIMVGRATLGNPWIIRDLVSQEEVVSIHERIDMLLAHAQKLMSHEPEKYAMIQMRSHAAWYFRHLPQSKKYRVQLVNISTYDELKNICLEYLNNLT